METRTIALTPEFASPEHIRGESATTATDVYGLGGVLYFLLTGKTVHTVTGNSPAELQQAICESAPESPSRLRPLLKGDLENILLKALHIEPERRYRSAQNYATISNGTSTADPFSLRVTVGSIEASGSCNAIP